MTSDLSEPGGTLANYVLPFQVPQPPKKVLKGENKGGTTLVKFARPLKSYLPIRILTGVNYNLCCCCCALVIFARPN